ncbi:MAG: outer membrane beta-barrel protein [Alphaproteobacteria bacterium]|nr:outer membrane beta-barrel protein [Alphaproteobacteria bacterium]
MKKNALLFMCGALLVSMSGADAASYVVRDQDGKYLAVRAVAPTSSCVRTTCGAARADKVSWSERDSGDGNWYLGGRVDINFLSWKNEYSSSQAGVNVWFDHDDYSFEPVFGGDIFIGYAFNDLWRLDVEGGMIGSFEDADDNFSFKMTVPYITLNGYRDFSNGLYVGLGVGVALPKTELSGAFYSENRIKRESSLMGSLMLGWSSHLSEDMVLDLRYRLAVFDGTTHSRVLSAGDLFKNEIGMVLDNSVSVGLRYEF